MAISLARTEYACVRVVLDHPIDDVWRIAGRFDGLESWADGVSACTVEGEGVGAVRAVTRGGVVREQLESLNPEHHQISYRILPPHALPAEDVRGVITLIALGPEATEIIWRSDAAKLNGPVIALTERIEAFYRASIRGLEQHLRTAAPRRAKGRIIAAGRSRL
jgi:hypothetical protein